MIPRRLTIDPSTVMPASDFSTRVVCREGFDIAVDRTMSWGGGIEGHSSIGVPGATRTWYLAKGSSPFGFETWLRVQNPNAAPVKVTLTYMTTDGPIVKGPVRVPAG